MFSDVEDRAEKLCPRSHCRELSELGLGRGPSDSGSWFFSSALGGETLRGRTSGIFLACRSPDMVPGPAVSALLGTLSQVQILSPTAEWPNQTPLGGLSRLHLNKFPADQGAWSHVQSPSFWNWGPGTSSEDFEQVYGQGWSRNHNVVPVVCSSLLSAHRQENAWCQDTERCPSIENLRGKNPKQHLPHF